MQEVPLWVEYLVNNGVAIGMVIYFAIRDWMFTKQLTETLITIKQLLQKSQKEEQ